MSGQRTSNGGCGLGVLILGALLLLGCQVGRAMIATSGDYEDYRRIRTAESLDERLAASWYYINHRRDGVYAERVRAYFKRAEPVFWTVRRRTLAGLQVYLQALPNGPHADEALTELVRLRQRRRRELAAELSAAKMQDRMDAERRHRLQAGELAITWLQQLVQPALWAGRLSEAPSEFIVPYRLELPHPSCEFDAGEQVYRCSKVIERSFEVVEQGEKIVRPVLLWVELELSDDWRLRGARLLGPSLFLRRAEARQRAPVPIEDADARQRAVEQFERRVMEVLAEPELDCVPAEAATRLAVRCGRLLVVIRPGHGEEDDEIRVQLARPPDTSSQGTSPGGLPVGDADLREPSSNAEVE